MAKCKECGEQVVWATVKNGKDAGKKRPFDPNAADNGRYGLVSLEETDKYGKQLIEASYYEDPVAGLSNHEELFNNHFFTCPNKKSGRAPSGGVERVFVMVQIGNQDYTGYLSKNGVAGSAPVEEEPPF